MTIWKWIQRFGSSQIYKRKRISAFIIDETVIQIGNRHFWLLICIEPVHKTLFGIYISESIICLNDILHIGLTRILEKLLTYIDVEMFSLRFHVPCGE